MDEPCSALDPMATLQDRAADEELRPQYTIVIVTHNMQQASGCATTAFLNMGEDRAGYLVEEGPTVQIFTAAAASASQRTTSPGGSAELVDPRK